MSIYSEATLGTDNNSVTFNDYGANPVFRVKTRAPRQFQVRQDDIPIPFESGISDFNTLIGQTIYVLQGTMYPKDEVTYDTGLDALRKIGNLDYAQADPDSDLGYVPYQWGEALGDKLVFMKVLYVQAVEDTRQGFVQPFVIYTKIKDPTIYGSELKQANTTQANPVTGGGAAAYPFAYPIAYGATTYSVTADANNAGSIPSYPFAIEVYGPIVNPRITNQRTGEYFEVDVSMASGSDYLNIQYDKDTYTVTLNGVSVINNVTDASTQFKIQPGDNPITLTGTTVSTGAYAIVSYRDSYALA